MKPPAWLLALGMTACSGVRPPPTHYTVQMADPYPWSSYLDGVTRAAAEWSAATGLAIDVRVSGQGCGERGTVCVYAVPVAFGESGPQGQRGGYTTLADNWAATVQLAAGLDAPTVHAMALHELGHAIGLEHTGDPADCMYPVVPVAVRVGPGDVEQFRAVYGGAL